MNDLNTADGQKRAAALAALDHLEPGMRVGLGTGSTAEHFVTLLGERVKAGFALRACVATSERTATLARNYGLPLVDLNDVSTLDMTVDGADELDQDLNLIKGGGGALLREKVVAAASARMIVIADSSKLVNCLGAFPLPVEIVPFGWKHTAAKVAEAARAAGCTENFTHLRGGEAHPAHTDQGNLIVDIGARCIPDPQRLAAALSAIPGVVEHGLFLGLARVALLAGGQGVRKLGQG
ncbi:MAG TPA: ribose 5-phosphate isomerase A [Alphaproteobacteria bacterium]|nr:ribose 5-phosphate isomerase A [Alphaproteobacteria bacterium]HAJ45995.1 ribose 5-phosphate isomerase A [Alphaproteobacteria bacterium]